MIRKYEEIVHRTQKAILFRFDVGDCWVPNAMIEELDEYEKEVEIYPNFRFQYLKPEPKVEDMFDEIEPEPVVEKKIKVTVDNPLGLDLDIYYTDGTRRDELPF